MHPRGWATCVVECTRVSPARQNSGCGLMAGRRVELGNRDICSGSSQRSDDLASNSTPTASNERDPTSKIKRIVHIAVAYHSAFAEKNLRNLELHFHPLRVAFSQFKPLAESIHWQAMRD